MRRLQAVQTGFTLLAMTILIVLSAWVIRLISADPLPSAHIIEVLIRFDSSFNFGGKRILNDSRRARSTLANCSWGLAY